MASERACERGNCGKERRTEQSCDEDDFLELYAPKEEMQMRMIIEEWLWTPS